MADEPKKPSTVVDASDRFTPNRVCFACSKPIRNGEHYLLVNTPQGPRQPVHSKCAK
jgi:hypothetical protein